MRITRRMTGPRKPTVGPYAAMVLALLVEPYDGPKVDGSGVPDLDWTNGDEPYDRQFWPEMIEEGRRVRLEAERLGITEDEFRVRELMAASVMEPVVA